MDGRVALVTGGGSGIGRASAIAFARRGAAVVVADLNGEGAEETARLAGDAVTTFVGDTAEGSVVEQLVAECVRRHGRLDYVHNNAGVRGHGLLHDISEQDWDAVNRVNLRGAWLVLKHALRAMHAQGGVGAIVNTASVGGERALFGTGAYCASKAGVVMLTRVAAVENGAGIRVNAVAPGPVATPMTADYQRVGGGPPPSQRLALPEEVAEAAVWLCSDAASYVNGVCLTVDGGWTAAARSGPPPTD
jgi:NAD(P)-dependent dehydrogenase (short-subunit alcohol dehydrogenase family)